MRTIHSVLLLPRGKFCGAVRPSLFAFVLFLSPFLLRSQSQSPLPSGSAEEIERLLEESNQGEEPAQEPADLLEEYRARPLPLRTATVEELSRLPGISPQTARRVLQFVAAESPKEIDDLAALRELEPEMLAILRLYTTLDREGVTAGSGEGKSFALNLRTRIVQELQKRRGYDTRLYRLQVRRAPDSGDSLGIDTISLGPYYLGTSQGILTRLHVRYGSFSGGITFEKDPGEPLFYVDTLGFSYENFERADTLPLVSPEIRRGIGSFLSLHGRAELKPATIVLGDYTAEFGQGLLFGESFAGRKGSAPTRDPHRSAAGLRSYRSSGEAFYFRGIGATLKGGEWLPSWLEGSIFLSRRSLDGSVTESLSVEGDTAESALRFVSSIRSDGYLRTRSEIRRNDVLTEEIAGLHAIGRFGEASLGFTAYHGRYDLRVAGSLFDGNPTERWSMASLEGAYDFKFGHGFGEVAVSDRPGFAGIAGLALQFPRADVTLSGRYYGATFYSPHGVAFGESPVNPRNEGGIYIGIRTRLFPRAILSLYGDLYRVPRENESVPFAVTGMDGMALFEYGPGHDLRIGIRLKGERRGDAAKTIDEAGRSVTHAVDRAIAGGRLDIAWTPKKGNIEARFRLEGKIARYSDILPDADGMLTFVDFRWSPLSSLALGSRLLLFRTESPDVQLYEFEQDVPGRLTSVPLSGEGSRFYLLARWEASHSFTLSARYGETWYGDRETISPGSLQQINGNTQGQLVVQGDWNLGG